MNRLAAETSPYLLQHAENPVDWYPWGPEALERARARGPADPALGRLQRLPLVPRDGARVVRERGDGGADERALRQRQGRPRGAARRRRALHGRDRLDDRAGRLADDRLPHARPASRSTPARTSRPSRGTGCRRSPSCCSRWPRRGRRSATTSSRRRAGSSRRSSHSARIEPSDRAAHRGAARRGGARDRAHLRAAPTAASAARRSSRPPRRSSSCSAAARPRRWRW